MLATQNFRFSYCELNRKIKTSQENTSWETTQQRERKLDIVILLTPSPWFLNQRTNIFIFAPAPDNYVAGLEAERAWKTYGGMWINHLPVRSLSIQISPGKLPALKMLFRSPDLLKKHNLQLASQATLEVFLALNRVQLYTKGVRLFLNGHAKLKPVRSRKVLLNGFIRSQQQRQVKGKIKQPFASHLFWNFIPPAPLCFFPKGRALFSPKSLQQSQQNLFQAWQPIYMIHRFLAKLLKLIRWQTFILVALINKRIRFPGGGNVSKYSSF